MLTIDPIYVFPKSPVYFGHCAARRTLYIYFIYYISRHTLIKRGIALRCVYNMDRYPFIFDTCLTLVSMFFSRNFNDLNLVLKMINLIFIIYMERYDAIQRIRTLERTEKSSPLQCIWILDILHRSYTCYWCRGV